MYDMVYLKEIKGEKVPNEKKIYSIYEQHTDIIVKGSREVQFGHKVDICSGKSNLVLNCQVLRGNPSDTALFAPAGDMKPPYKQLIKYLIEYRTGNTGQFPKKSV